MTLFDVNTFIGRWPSEKLAFHNVDDLLHTMEHLQIERALVSHTIAWQNSSSLGNKLLMDSLAGHPNLEPCWIIKPSSSISDDPYLANLFLEMQYSGIRAVRLFPRDHVYSLQSKTSHALLEELNRKNYLVIIDLDQIFTQSGLYDYSASSLEVLGYLCQKYSQASFLLTKLGYRAFQVIYPLLETYPNLYIDLSYLATHQGVETIVSNLGATKIIFGTGQPLIDPGGSILRILSADISPKDKENISHKNLDRLLNRVFFKPQLRISDSNTLSISNNTSLQNWDEILHNNEITDAHVHMGPYYKFHIPQNSAEEMLKVMDRMHINQSCVSSHLAITGDWYQGNRLTAKAVSNHPERFIGYVVVSPNEPEMINDELNRAFNDWNFKGIKLVPDNHQQPIGSDGYRSVFEFASDKKCLVLVHTYHGSPYDDPKLFGDLAIQYPDVPLLMVHSGALPGAFEGAIQLAKKHRNLFLDISGSFITGFWISRMVKEVGANKVLFSSDQPFIDPRYSLGRLLNANLSLEELSCVLGRNIRYLLNYPVNCYNL